MRTIFRGIAAYTSQISCHLCDLVCFENVLTLPENFTCNHLKNLSKPLNNSQPRGIFLIPPENFTHTLKMSQPPQYFLTTPLPEKNLNPSRIYNLNPSEKISTPPEKIATPTEKMSTRPPE